MSGQSRSMTQCSFLVSRFKIFFKKENFRQFVGKNTQQKRKVAHKLCNIKQTSSIFGQKQELLVPEQLKVLTPRFGFPGEKSKCSTVLGYYCKDFKVKVTKTERAKKSNLIIKYFNQVDLPSFDTTTLVW